MFCIYTVQQSYNFSFYGAIGTKGTVSIYGGAEPNNLVIQNKTRVLFLFLQNEIKMYKFIFFCADGVLWM